MGSGPRTRKSKTQAWQSLGNLFRISGVIPLWHDSHQFRVLPSWVIQCRTPGRAGVYLGSRSVVRPSRSPAGLQGSKPSLRASSKKFFLNIIAPTHPWPLWASGQASSFNLPKHLWESNRKSREACQNGLREVSRKKFRCGKNYLSVIIATGIHN